MSQHKVLLQMLLVLTLLLSFVSIVSAESVGCAAINGGSNLNIAGIEGHEYLRSPIAFEAGETVSWDISSDNYIYVWVMDSNNVLLLDYVLNGANVTDSGSLTFPADDNYYIDFSVHYNAVHALNVTCSPATVTEDTPTPAVPSILYPPDNRLNWQYGDLGAVLYRSADSAGNPAIDVYCYDGGISWLGMQANDATASGTSADGCNATFYILPEGGYQFNISYDGKLYEIRCSDFACEEPDMSYFDPNE